MFKTDIDISKRKNTVCIMQSYSEIKIAMKTTEKYYIYNIIA